MKRLLIILLLAIMPFQAAWAAACACCIGDEGKVAQQTSQAIDQQQAPHLRGELRRYVSHIPDLIPPPDRPLRA